MITKLKEYLRLLKIRYYKFKACNAYAAYCDIYDSMSCGHSMTQHVSADARHWAREFDIACARLAQLDPSAPRISPLSMQ